MSPQSTFADDIVATAAPARTRAASIVFDRLPIEPSPAFLVASPLPSLRLVPIRPVRDDASGASRGGCTDRLPRASRQPIRLTRRGRLLLVVMVATLLSVLVVAVRAGSSVAAGPAGARPTAAANHQTSVVVQPGDTLWSIATRVAPNADPRVTVQKIIDLNSLTGVAIEAGEQLNLPS